MASRLSVAVFAKADDGRWVAIALFLTRIDANEFVKADEVSQPLQIRRIHK